MNELTPLEREVMSAILSSLVPSKDEIARILKFLVISSRSFSADIFNKDSCVGFYLEFASNAFLVEIGSLPNHLGVQARHNALPTGGDFILFFDKDKGGVKVLEASFFGHTLPIAEVISTNHGFAVQTGFLKK